MYGSAGYIVIATDTATEAICNALRYIQFGRVYRNRTEYCDRSHMQCATLYTALRYEQLSRSLERSWFKLVIII